MPNGPMDIEGALAAQSVFGQSMQPHIDRAAKYQSALGSDPLTQIPSQSYKPEDFSSYQGFRESMGFLEALGKKTHPAIEAERESIEQGRRETRESQAKQFELGSMNPYRMIPGYADSMERQRKKTLGEWTKADEDNWRADQTRRSTFMEGIGSGPIADRLKGVTGLSDVGGDMTKNLIAGAQTMALGALPGLNDKALTETFTPPEIQRQHQSGEMGRGFMKLYGEAAPYLMGAPVASSALGGLATATKLGRLTQAAPMVQRAGAAMAPIAATQAAISATEGRRGSEILEDASVAALIGQGIQLARPLTRAATGAIGKYGPKVAGKPLYGQAWAKAPTSKAAMLKDINAKNMGGLIDDISKGVRTQYQSGVLDFTRYPIESIAEGVIGLTMARFPALMAGDITGDQVKQEAFMGGVLDLVLSSAFKGAPFEQALMQKVRKMNTPEQLSAIVQGARAKIKGDQVSEIGKMMADRDATEALRRPEDYPLDDLASQYKKTTKLVTTGDIEPTPSAAKLNRARDLKSGLDEFANVVENTPESALRDADGAGRTPGEAAMRGLASEAVVKEMRGPDEVLSSEAQGLLDLTLAQVRAMRQDKFKGLPAPVGPPEVMPPTRPTGDPQLNAGAAMERMQAEGQQVRPDQELISRAMRVVDEFGPDQLMRMDPEAGSALMAAMRAEGEESIVRGMDQAPGEPISRGAAEQLRQVDRDVAEMTGRGYEPQRAHVTSPDRRMRKKTDPKRKLTQAETKSPRRLSSPPAQPKVSKPRTVESPTRKAPPPKEPVGQNVPKGEMKPRKGVDRRQSNRPPPGGIDRRKRKDRRRSVLRGRKGQVVEATAKGFTDALTGVANRASFDSDQKAIESDPNLGYFSADATSLGVMNDYGSPSIGDATLVGGASRIRDILSGMGYKEVGVLETPGKGEFKVYRPGGDEFFAGGDKEAMKKLEGVLGDFNRPETFIQGMSSPKIGRAESRVIGGYGDTKDLADVELNTRKKAYKSKASERGLFIQKKADKFEAGKILKEAGSFIRKGGATAQREAAEAYTKVLREKKFGDEQSLAAAQIAFKKTIDSIKKKGGFVEPKAEEVSVFKDEESFKGGEAPKVEARPKPKQPRNPKPSDPLKGQRGMGIDVIGAALPTKEEMAKAANVIRDVVSSTVAVVKRGVNEFAGYPLASGARAVLPDVISKKLQDVAATNKVLSELTKRPGQQAIWADTKTSAHFFHLMNLKGWKDATALDAFKDPVHVFGESVPNIWEEGFVRANQRQMRFYREALYKPDGPIARLQAHYGLANKRVRVSGSQYKKAKGAKAKNEAGYRETMKRVSDALEYDGVFKNKGQEYIDKNGFTKASELKSHELPLFRAARKVYDDFRARYAEKYNRDAPEDWGLHDYVNHIMKFEGTKSNDNYAVPGGMKSDVERNKFAGHAVNRKWADLDYVRDVEQALTEYIPAAINKLNYESTIAKLEPVVNGVFRTTRNAGKIFSDLKSGVLVASGQTMTRDAGSDFMVRFPSEGGKRGEYEYAQIQKYDKDSITVRRVNGELATISRDQLDWSGVPKGGKARRDFLASNPRVSVRYRQYYRNPKTKQVFGLDKLFLMKNNEERSRMMRRYYRDITNSHDAQAAERFFSGAATFHHHQFLGFLNPKSAALNFSQSLITVSEVGAVTTAKATASLAGKSVKLGNGSTFTKARRDEVIRDVLLDDDYYAQSKDFAEGELERMVKLDPNSPLTKTEAFARVSMAAFQFSEIAMRQQATVAGYMDAINRGATHQQALTHAREVVAKTQGIYRRHRAPQVFRRRGRDTEGSGRTRRSSRLNAAKSAFLLFKRFGVMQGAWMAGSIADMRRFGRASSAQARLAKLQSPPVIPPSSPAFEEMGPRAQAAHKAAYEKLRSSDKAKAQAVDKAVRDMDRLQSAELYDPTKALKFAGMVAGLMYLGEKLLKVDWGGTLVAWPFDVGRIIKNTNQDSYRGFVDSITPPSIQQAIKTTETLALISTALKSDTLGWSDPQIHDAIYDLFKTLVAPNSLKEPLDAALGLTEAIPKDDPAYDPEKPIGKYKFSKLTTNPGQRPRKMSVADVIRRISVPGRPLDMKLIEEAFQEAREEKEIIALVQESQRRVAENIVHFQRSGQSDKVSQEVGKLRTLSERVGKPFSKRQFENAIKRRKLQGFAAKVMTGSKSERWGKFRIALDKSSKGGGSVLSKQDAKYIFGELSKGTASFEGMQPEKVIETIKRYRSFLKKAQ